MRLFLILSVFFAVTPHAALATPDVSHNSRTLHRVRWIQDIHTKKSNVVSHKKLLLPQSANRTLLRTSTIPAQMDETQHLGSSELHEVEGADIQAVIDFLKEKSVVVDSIALAAGNFVSPERASQAKGTEVNDEVKTLISSGPAANRIDIVFMGDGYTASEKEKFFADINRLVDDMFLGNTFKSYLPVFNVHAVFRPSGQSGIGKGKPGNTAYGLYREGDTLRAIFPGDPSALRDSCNQAPDCDYPVVIANDSLYGGLGGEFAISTSSMQSGTVVLRHELGHNFGRVGEEYDGGGYFGANHADDVDTIGWQHWAVESSTNIQEESMIARYLAWPWHQFQEGQESQFEANFKSNGQYSRTSIRFSASGFDEPGSLDISLDGVRLQFTEPTSEDRTFVDIDLPQGLTAGDHRLIFSATSRSPSTDASMDTSRNPSMDTTATRGQWLSSLTVHEYAANFPDSPDVISAFPVFDEFRSVAGFRPTNESCLMRNMTHEHFCRVCQENNWNKFLNKIDLIDSASAIKGTTGIISGEVSTIALGKFRQLGEGPAGERVEIHWFGDGKELLEFRDYNRWEAKSPVMVQRLEVEVKLVSPEIRRDSLGNTTQRIIVRTIAQVH